METDQSYNVHENTNKIKLVPRIPKSMDVFYLLSDSRYYYVYPKAKVVFYLSLDNVRFFKFSSDNGCIFFQFKQGSYSSPDNGSFLILPGHRLFFYCYPNNCSFFVPRQQLFFTFPHTKTVCSTSQRNT